MKTRMRIVGCTNNSDVRKGVCGNSFGLQCAKSAGISKIVWDRTRNY